MEVVIIDLETTGFTPQSGKIVEIGMVLLDLDTGKISPLMNFVTHQDGISLRMVETSWIVQNSTLTTLEIRYSINFKYLVPIIQNIASEYNVTAFNRNFDIRFLEAAGVKFQHLYPCPMVEATPILKLPRGTGYKWPSVEEAYRYFYPDDPYNEQHRAYDDAYHEAKIVYALHLLKIKNNE